MKTTSISEITSESRSTAFATAVITAALVCPLLTEYVLALTTSGEIRRAVSLLDSVNRCVDDLLLAHNYVPCDPCDEDCGDNIDSNAETLSSFASAVNTASMMLEEFGDVRAARTLLEEAHHDLAAKAVQIRTSLSPID